MFETLKSGLANHFKDRAMKFDELSADHRLVNGSETVAFGEFKRFYLRAE